MTTNIQYKILAEVNILHHYFLNEGKTNFEGMNLKKQAEMLSKYSVNDFLQVYPSRKTSRLLNGRNILFRNTTKGFALLTATDPADPDKAMADLTDSIPLFFHMILKDPFFMNYTALSLRKEPDTIYFFSNSGKAAFQFPNLSKTEPEFDSAAAGAASSDGDPDTFAYYPGDIITDDKSNPKVIFEAAQSTNDDTGTTAHWRRDTVAESYDNTATYKEGDVVTYSDSGDEAVFEAKAETTGVKPDDTSKWNKLRELPLHYVTSEDLLGFISQVFNYSFSGPGIDADFEVQDAAGNTVITDSFTSSSLKLSHQLDLRKLKDGIYTVKVTDNSGPTELLNQKFFLFSEFTDTNRTYGIIELFTGSGSGNYSFVDSSNKISPRTFEIRFKNRSTVWRYYNQDQEIQHISQSNPLTLNGFITEIFSGKELPNPDANIFRPEPAQYYSDLFIHTNS